MREVAERALQCLGRGFDVASDFRPKHCKGKQRLVLLNEDECVDLAVPVAGGGVLQRVSVDIKCGKGDRVRYQSDVLEFNRGLTVVCSRRGGDASASSHYEWLLTVPSMPDIINFTFVPITSLMKGVAGAGFLAHAINLYLRCMYNPSPTKARNQDGCIKVKSNIDINSS